MSLVHITLDDDEVGVILIIPTGRQRKKNVSRLAADNARIQVCTHMIMKSEGGGGSRDSERDLRDRSARGAGNIPTS